MNKKVISLTLAAISMAALALPTVAVGVPIEDPGGVSFTGTFDTSTFTTEGEPTVTCEGKNHVEGSLNASGSGGTIGFDYTNCHIVVLGFTIACKTPGAALGNTVGLPNLAFDNIYATDGKTKPAILVTNINATIECGSTTPLLLTGNVIGTLTAPACNTTATTASFLFIAAVAVQQHMQIDGTGNKFDLSAETKSSGTKKTTGLDSEFAVKYSSSVTQTCV